MVHLSKVMYALLPTAPIGITSLQSITPTHIQDLPDIAQETIQVMHTIMEQDIPSILDHEVDNSTTIATAIRLTFLKDLLSGNIIIVVKW